MLLESTCCCPLSPPPGPFIVFDHHIWQSYDLLCRTPVSQERLRLPSESSVSNRSLHGKNLTTIGYKHPQAITKAGTGWERRRNNAPKGRCFSWKLFCASRSAWIRRFAGCFSLKGAFVLLPMSVQVIDNLRSKEQWFSFTPTPRNHPRPSPTSITHVHHPRPSPTSIHPLHRSC